MNWQLSKTNPGLHKIRWPLRRIRTKNNWGQSKKIGVISLWEVREVPIFCFVRRAGLLFWFVASKGQPQNGLHAFSLVDSESGVVAQWPSLTLSSELHGYFKGAELLSFLYSSCNVVSKNSWSLAAADGGGWNWLPEMLKLSVAPQKLLYTSTLL